MESLSRRYRCRWGHPSRGQLYIHTTGSGLDSDIATINKFQGEVVLERLGTTQQQVLIARQPYVKQNRSPLCSLAVSLVKLCRCTVEIKSHG